MTRLALIFIFLPTLLFGQDRSNWTRLDFLNRTKENPFIPQDNINGICFVTLADTFNYYKKPIIINDKDKNEVLKIQFTDSLGLTTTFNGKKYSRRDTGNTFNPWLWINSEEYFQLAFECTDTSGAYYKVLLTNKDFAFINKKNKDFKKQSIASFVKEWTSIGFDFDRSANPLRQSANDNSKIIKHKDQDKYKIWQGESIEVKGDWIKVKTVKDEVGWVRWRQGKKVLIRLYFAC